MKNYFCPDDTADRGLTHSELATRLNPRADFKRKYKIYILLFNYLKHFYLKLLFFLIKNIRYLNILYCLF